jgi:hypothetical protein
MIVSSARFFRAVIVSLGIAACARPAQAQTRVYVTGDLFGEIIQLSKTTVIPALEDSVPQALAPPDGVTLGGGARVGAFFTPVCSLELGVDIGRAIDEERTLSIRSPLGLLVPPRALEYRSRTSQRYAATSVLAGYHPVVRGRIQPGFRGGISFMRSERSFTVASASFLTISPTVPGGGIILPTVVLLTNDYTTVSYGLTATLAAEVAIDLASHFAIVPEMRALGGGLGGIVLRPGVAARWRW